jgi:hypothetical protein
MHLCTGFKKQLFGSAFSVLRIMPGVEGQVEKGVNEALQEMEKTIMIPNDAERLTRMPEDGWQPDRIIEYMRTLKALEEAKWKPGKVSGVIYSNGMQ